MGPQFAELTVPPPPRSLPRKFFDVSVVDLAKNLLGQLLISETKRGICGGRIVETEAYAGVDDAASHAARGPTPRSKIMFGPGGVAYVYFTYGTHHCVNVVAGVAGVPGAVLIRALEPTFNLELMQKRRGREDVRELCSGPGKLCQALGIDLSHNGLDLRGSALKIFHAPAVMDVNILAGPRIGIRRAVDLPWRFYERDSKFISKYSSRPAANPAVPRSR